MEVPVFFSRARDGKDDTCLGFFEGYSLMAGPPAQPDEMPRITLCIDALAEEANHQRNVFLRGASANVPPRIGTLFRVG